MIKYLSQNIFQAHSPSCQLQQAEDLEKQTARLEKSNVELNELFVEMTDYIESQVILFYFDFTRPNKCLVFCFRVK